MIRATLLSLVVSLLAVYAWRDWYKALCGLILLMAVIEHPDMPKSLFGIQGLNLWNLLLLDIVLAWMVARGREQLTWDMPRRINVLLFLFGTVMVVGFFRMLGDRYGIDEWATTVGQQPASTAGLVSDHLINRIKWVIPGLLLFDGCRDRSRFLWAMFSLLGMYVLLALLVIRWMPLDLITSGEALMRRSLRVLDREMGYHRVDLSAMLAGASWAILSVRVLLQRRSYSVLLLLAGLTVIFAQVLTGGRMGYATWMLIGLTLGVIRWPRYLLLAPVLLAAIVTMVPAALERMTDGFNPDLEQAAEQTRQQALQQERISNYMPLEYDNVDLYTVTAGRNIAWPLVIAKIKEAPFVGYGFEAMQRTGISILLLTELGESFPHPHNAYLQLLLDSGLIGAIPVLLLFFLIARYSLALARDSRDPLYMAAGCVGVALVFAQLIGAMGSQSFYPREGTVGMWCAIGLVLRVYVERARLLAGTKAADAQAIETPKLWGQPA